MKEHNKTEIEICFQSRNSEEKVVFDSSIILFKPLFGSAGLIICSGWSGVCLGGVRATFIVSLLLCITTDERPEDQFIKPTAGTS